MPFVSLPCLAFLAKAAVTAPLTDDAPYPGDLKTFLSRYHLKFRRAGDGDDFGEPASFAFLQESGHDGYRANFALVYAPKAATSLNSRLRAFAEFNLADKDSDAERTVRAKIGYRFAGRQRNARDFALILTTDAKYEADQAFEAQQAAFDVALSPVTQALRMNIGSPDDRIGFVWSPKIGAEAGRVLERGSINQDDKDVLNLYARAKAYLIFRQRDGAKSPYLWAEDVFYYRSEADGQKDRNLFASGFAFPITTEVTFGITYKNGFASPTFKRVNTFEIDLGVKF